jgi:chorismate synthase
MDLLVRPVATLVEYHACEALQRRIWNMPDDLEVVPLHLLVTVHRNGGLLLGAFRGGDLAGFVFGFPGLDPAGRPNCRALASASASSAPSGRPSWPRGSTW